MPANLPYPFQFDPSQLKNPYTRYANVALPWYSTALDSSGLYGGDVPTDAMGNPIQSYVDANNAAQSGYQAQLAAYNASAPAATAPGATPGTTLNSTPAYSPGGSLASQPGMQEYLQNYNAAQAAKSPQQLQIDAQNAAYRNAQLQSMQNMSDFKAAQGGFGNMPGGAFNPNPGYIPQPMAQSAPAAPAAPSRPPPPSPPNMTQAYLNALANPGKVTTPGATVAQAAPPSNSSNVLQAFLADWKNQGSPTKGAGAYDNSGFFNALQQGMA